MGLEGHVEIVLPQDRDLPVEVRLTEPADISSLLTGRTPAEVLGMVPALYSLCGTAHSAAAAFALESAGAVEADSETVRIRTCLVLMERAREHLLRIALDWPKLIGEPPNNGIARLAMRLLPDLRSALDPEGQVFRSGFARSVSKGGADDVIGTAKTLAEQHVYGENLPVWQARQTQNDMDAWTKAGDTVAARLIAAIDKRFGRELAAIPAVFLPDALPVAAPVAEERIAETTPLGRHRAHPVLEAGNPSLSKRYLARLVDLAATLSELELLNTRPESVLPSGKSTTPGYGYVETARGRLIHIVVLRGGRVDSYRILSPTRWNFSENGIAFRCLEALPDCDDTARIELADLVVGAIDPCVSHRVRIH